MIDVYIINLKDSIKKREYIRQVFAPYREAFNFHWIEAIDGRNLSDGELCDIFDQEKAFRIYGRYLKGGEVGCALSHRLCHAKILKQKKEVALIIEDDMLWQDKNIINKLSKLQSLMSIRQPMIVLLSGDYWFTTIKKKDGGLKLAKVREAVCTHAYMINRSAAKIMLETEKCYLADDWYSLTHSRIELYGLYPHIADQNRRDVNTDISAVYEGLVRKNLSFTKCLYSYYRGIIKHFLYYIGHFEFKNFIN